MPTKKQTGNRCEHLVVSRLLQPGPGPHEEPLFNPALLGSVTVMSEVDKDTGLDFLIRVGTTPRQVDWMAGVAVKGCEQPPPLQHCLQMTERQIAALGSRHPAFLLVVDVRSERLYFSWIRPPVESADWAVPACVCLEPIDNASFKGHIDQIRSYYKKMPAASSIV